MAFEDRGFTCEGRRGPAPGVRVVRPHRREARGRWPRAVVFRRRVAGRHGRGKSLGLMCLANLARVDARVNQVGRRVSLCRIPAALGEETPRLLLRPLDLFDADELQRAFPRREIVQYLSPGGPWPYPAGGARSMRMPQ